MSERYEPIVKIASGGMATVYLGALKGAHGFRKLVAIKRPHAHLTEDPQFRATLLAEARLAARLHHANVVDVRDVEPIGDSVQLVMDYVEGASLGDLIAAGPKLSPGVAARIVLDACAGLHAAHELEGDDGRPLGLLHRDVSPQNILVGTDGVSRVTDFGIAKSKDAAARPTTEGTLKGKLGYMAPEYVRGAAVDRRADVFALGVVLWESLSGVRLFRGANDAETVEKVQRAEVPPVEPEALLDVAARALAREPDARFATADEMRVALEATQLAASHADVGRHVKEVAGEAIEARRRAVREHEEGSRVVEAPPPSAAAAREAVTRQEPMPARPSRIPRVAGALLLVAIASAVAVYAWRPRRVASPPPPVSTASSPTASSPPASEPPSAPSASSSAAEPIPAPAKTIPPRASPRPVAPTSIGSPTNTKRAPPNPYPP